MNGTTRKLKKLEPKHAECFRKLIACLDTIRSKGLYNRFYAEWYKRASQAKGAHEEYIYEYFVDKPTQSIDEEAWIENAHDAIKNCNAYVTVCKKFYADNPLHVFLDLQSAAEELKGIFNEVLSEILS